MAGPEKSEVYEKARGRWRDIVSAIGIDAKHLTGKNTACPMCGGRDRFRFSPATERGAWICSGCSPQGGDGMKLVQAFKKASFPEALALVDGVVGTARVVPSRKVDEAKLRADLNALWSRGTVIATGDPVELYLKRRGLPLPDARYIRTVRELEYIEPDEERSHHWGMLAKLLGPDGKPSTIHRTYLTNDGRKAPVAKVRKLHAGKIAKGGAVRCIPMKADTEYLGIAEGIETALAAFRLSGIPCWAALSAQMLEAWMPPPEAKHIFIFGDSDQSYTGQAAAFALAKRLTLIEKRKVTVHLPANGEPVGEDWNDVLLRGEGNGIHERGEAGGAPKGVEVPATGLRAADRGRDNESGLRQGAD